MQSPEPVSPRIILPVISGKGMFAHCISPLHFATTYQFLKNTKIGQEKP
jgi:hypothetical protein